jgi:hypothetical protein
MKICLIISILIVSSSLHEVAQSKLQKAQQIEIVRFCDLLDRPELYAGRTIRIRALFTRGGEDWEAIYCPQCSNDKNLVRPEFDDAFEQATPSSVRKKLARWDTTLKVVLVGSFDPKHSSFHIIRMEAAEVISKSGSSPWRLPNQLKGRDPC